MGSKLNIKHYRFRGARNIVSGCLFQVVFVVSWWLKSSGLPTSSRLSAGLRRTRKPLPPSLPLGRDASEDRRIPRRGLRGTTRSSSSVPWGYGQAHIEEIESGGRSRAHSKALRAEFQDFSRRLERALNSIPIGVPENWNSEEMLFWRKREKGCLIISG